MHVVCKTVDAVGETNWVGDLQEGYQITKDQSSVVSKYTTYNVAAGITLEGRPAVVNLRPKVRIRAIKEKRKRKLR